MIDFILDDFALHTKVHQIVTKNGTNFVKAAKEFYVRRQSFTPSISFNKHFLPIISYKMKFLTWMPKLWL
jgi:hypothetical protein